MSTDKIENKGITVTPGEDESYLERQTENSIPYESSLNVEDDEAYYQAHPPAKSLSTMRFFSRTFHGSLAYDAPKDPENWQVVLCNTKDKEDAPKAMCWVIS